MALPDVFDTALGEHCGRQRDDRAVGVGQHLVHHAMTRDGGEGRCAMRAEDDQISLLGTALVEQLLGRIAGYDDGLNWRSAHAVLWE